MEPKTRDALPAATLGQYRIRAKIGSGGMGDVYDAVHTKLGKRVAIKTLRKRYLDDETIVARFLREGQLASRIRHPNIVDVTDVGVIGGLPCLVMEHLEGETLSAVIRRDGPYTAIGDLVDILLPTIAAMHFAHERGVLHRDLKPSNIFLSRAYGGELIPKVLDFGISKFVDESIDAALTTDSAFVGTPHYAAPEMMRADKAADGRADEYAMGVILYEATTGIRPYADKSGNFVDLAMAICEGKCPRPRQHKPELTEEFEAVILRAMALRADDRYATMRLLGEALLPYASERARIIWTPAFCGPTAPPPPPSSPSVRPPSSETGSPAVPRYPSTTPPGATFPSNGMSSMYPPPKSATTWAGPAVVAAGAAAILVVITGALFAWSARHAESEAHASAAVEAPPSLFSITVRSTPENASFELDGASAGTGQITRMFPRDGRTHVMRVSAPGYETLLVQFDEGRLPPESIVLRAASMNVAADAGVNTPRSWQGFRPTPGAKGKSTDGKPRTDNIDPWE